MLNIKLKRFIINVKQAWTEIFNEKEFEKKDMILLAKNKADFIMNLDIEYRLNVLKDINERVISRTKKELVDVKKKELLILSKLEEYEK